MKQDVEVSKQIKDGNYEGKIVRVEYRTDPFKYTDYVIDCNGMELKYGCPSKIVVDEAGKPLNQNAKLLSELGLLQEKGNDSENAIGSEVTFMVLNKTTDKGTFANIVADSVKLKGK